MKKNIIGGLIIFIVFIISLSVTYNVLHKNKGESEEHDTIVPMKEDTLHKETTSIPSVVESYTLEVTIGEPQQIDYTLKYNLKVQINNLPERAMASLSVYDVQTKQTVIQKESIDGSVELENIPPTDSGEYDLCIQWQDSIGKPGKVFKTRIKGLEPFKMKPLEAVEIERRMNKCDAQLIDHNYKIANNLKLSFTNIYESELYPESITDIYSKFRHGKWESVSIDSVQYNDYNQVSMITITINHVNKE